MKSTQVTLLPLQKMHFEIDSRAAYHQAGHAVAIYLGNKQKHLPAVFFQIVIMESEKNFTATDSYTQADNKLAANLEGGRLIQNLSLACNKINYSFSGSQQAEFLRAFDADIVNLLAGSLAEAKYVAARDDEIFNANLINLSALQFYGGNSDLDVITEYLDCFNLYQSERDKKLTELFTLAFSFVNKRTNWQAITAVAEYLKDKPSGVINCEEISAFLESNLTTKTYSKNLTVNETA